MRTTRTTPRFFRVQTSVRCALLALAVAVLFGCKGPPATVADRGLAADLIGNGDAGASDSTLRDRGPDGQPSARDRGASLEAAVTDRGTRDLMAPDRSAWPDGLNRDSK